MKFQITQSYLIGRNPIDVERLHPNVVNSLRDAVESLDYDAVFSRETLAKNRSGTQAAPTVLNDLLDAYLEGLSWKEFKRSFFTCDDEALNFEISGLPSNVQKARILAAGMKPYTRRTQTDFLVDRVAVENQFGKFFSVYSDITTKNPRLRHWGLADCAITLLPSKRLAAFIHGAGNFEMVKAMFTSIPRDDHPSMTTLLLALDIVDSPIEE